MRNINYIIWGISNEGGYNESISSSFDNNILPSFIKKSNSTGDEIRRIALAYASDNQRQNYFYSLERIDDKVLYTIYRTNWYRDNRISYDAITLIINKNYILENAALSLKKVILQYVSLKDSGVRDYNLSLIVSSLKVIQKSSNQKRNISSNSTHSYLIKNDKKAFKKYSSESELNKIFIDQKSSLLNFNKVFFITKLKYLEEGAQKLVNLNDIRPFDVRLENFNHSYHTLFVDGVRLSDLMGNVFSAYEGDKVEVRKNPGNRLEKSIIVTTNQSTIVLEKIKIKKPKPSNSRRNESQWKTKTNIFLMSSILIMLLAIAFLEYRPKIEDFLDSLSSDVSKNSEVNTEEELNQNRVVFKDNCFYIGGKEIIDQGELVSYFDNIGITIDGTTYYSNENKIFSYKESKEKNNQLNIDDLMKLKDEIFKDIEVANGLRIHIKSFIQNYESQNNNDKINRNNENLDQQKDIKVKKEVNNLPPIIKQEQNTTPQKIPIDCSADEVLEKLKITKRLTLGKIRRKIKKLDDDIKKDYSNSDTPNPENLELGQEFINAVNSCDCQLCNKIKQINKKDKDDKGKPKNKDLVDTYNDLVNQVTSYTQN